MLTLSIQHSPGFNSHLFAASSQISNSISSPLPVIDPLSLILQFLQLGFLTQFLSSLNHTDRQSLFLSQPQTTATQFQSRVTMQECWPIADRFSALFQEKPQNGPVKGNSDFRWNLPICKCWQLLNNNKRKQYLVKQNLPARHTVTYSLKSECKCRSLLFQAFQSHPETTFWIQAQLSSFIHGFSNPQSILVQKHRIPPLS